MNRRRQWIRRSATALLSLSLVGTMFQGVTVTAEPAEVYEEGIVKGVTSGKCGKDLTWTLDENGVLTVSGQGAMYNNPSIQSGGWGASNTSKITSVVIEEGVTTIGSSAFFGCSNLVNVTFPSSVKKIMSAAFAFCGGLREVQFQEGLEEIEEYAFQTSGLEKVEIPSTVKILSGLAFLECKTPSIDVSEENQTFASVDGVVFTKNMKSIVIYPSERPGDSYEIPDTVEIIAGHAFSEAKIKSIVIPSGVTTLMSNAFSESFIEEVTFPDSVTSVGTNVFYGCVNLRKAVLSKNLKTVTEKLFYRCGRLGSVTIPEGVERIEKDAFADTGLRGRIVIPSSMIRIEKGAFPSSVSLATDLSEHDGAYYGVGNVTFDMTKSYEAAFQILNLTNEKRKQEGAETLKMDQSLLELAMQRAAELAIYYEHARPSGEEIGDESGAVLAENITGGVFNPKDAVDVWMGAEKYKNNMLNGKYTKVGIGAVVVNGIHYWVQCFGDGGCTEAAAENYTDGDVKAQISVVDGAGTYFPEVILSDTVISVGGTATARILFRNGFFPTYVDPSCMEFVCSNENVSITPEGEIIGQSAGTVQITAYVKGVPSIKATAQMTVVDLTLDDYVKGDINGDGKVNLLDLRQMLRHICGKAEFSEAQLKLGDLDGSGKVDLLDLRKLLRFICGKITEL